MASSRTILFGIKNVLHNFSDPIFMRKKINKAINLPNKQHFTIFCYKLSFEKGYMEIEGMCTYTFVPSFI